MKIFSYILLILVIPGCFRVAEAQSRSDTSFIPVKDTLSFLRSTETYTKKLSSISCEFIQEKKMKMLREVSVSEGIFLFSRGDKVRWEYTSPFSYIVVISNGKMTVRDERKTRTYDMTGNRAFAELNYRLAGLIDGSLIGQHDEFRQSYFENNYLYKVKLEPRSEKMRRTFREMTVYLEKKDLSVQRIVMTEKNGDRTDLRFIKKTINQPIADEKFIIR